jgi:23S rRNA-/tRNA-specific pseudouridylate synthase
MCSCQFTAKKVTFNFYVQPVVMQKWSKNAVKRGEVKVVRVEHRTLYRQDLASLVEICPSATKWHFLRVYLAHLLSPVLGDSLYGSRVHQMMGVPISINPCSDAARGPKVKIPLFLQNNINSEAKNCQTL